MPFVRAGGKRKNAAVRPHEEPTDSQGKPVAVGDKLWLLVQVTTAKAFVEWDGTNATCEVVTECPLSGFRQQFALNTKQGKVAK